MMKMKGLYQPNRVEVLRRQINFVNQEAPLTFMEVEGVSLCLQTSASERVWSQTKLCHCLQESACERVWSQTKLCHCLQESASERVWSQTNLCHCLQESASERVWSQTKHVTVFTRIRQ
jgi:hypothetical protein